MEARFRLRPTGGGTIPTPCRSTSAPQRIVARAFIAHGRVRGVELMPLEMQTGIAQLIVDKRPPFAGECAGLGDPRSSATLPNLVDSVQAVVMHVLPQLALVDVRRVEAGCGPHIGLHCRAKCQMSPNANPRQLARAVR